MSFAVASLVLGLLVMAQAYRMLRDPSFVFLRSEGGAAWIGYDEPVYLKAWDPGALVTHFRTRFELSEPPDKAVLAIRATRRAVVTVDGRPLFETHRGLDRWKEPVRFDLAAHLSPGTHELQISVANENGPALVLAHCAPLGLHTGPEWEASLEGKDWSAPRLAEVPSRPQLAEQFGTVWRSFARLLPLYVPLFLLVAACVLWRSRPDGTAPRWTLEPGVVRWALLAAWLLLGVNNLAKIPTHVGMDVKQHVEYIRYVSETWRVPLANEGWQMFQSPLYYFVSAPFFLLFSTFFEAERLSQALRIVPLLCGAAQVELSYRAAQYMYPGRKDLQVLGAILGGLLPLNLYLAQVVGNEPMCSLWSGAVLVLLLKVLCDAPEPVRWPATLSIGCCLGLALLSKATALLLCPFVAITLAYPGAMGSERRLRRALLPVTTALGVAFVLAGWYYLRNWILLGRPFIGGWNPSRGFVWWQDPGRLRAASTVELRAGAVLRLARAIAERGGHPWHVPVLTLLEARPGADAGQRGLGGIPVCAFPPLLHGAVLQ